MSYDTIEIETNTDNMRVRINGIEIHITDQLSDVRIMFQNFELVKEYLSMLCIDEEQYVKIHNVVAQLSAVSGMSFEKTLQLIKNILSQQELNLEQSKEAILRLGEISELNFMKENKETGFDINSRAERRSYYKVFKDEMLEQINELIQDNKNRKNMVFNNHVCSNSYNNYIRTRSNRMGKRCVNSKVSQLITTRKFCRR